MEINGVAHVMLTVSNFEACYPFYEKLLTYLGMKPVMRSEEMLYCVGGRTAVGIMRGDDSYRKEIFQQRRVGLHHVCSARARARRRRPDLRLPANDRREDCASAGRWAVGAGILLGPVRGSRRDSARGESRAGQGFAGVR